MLERAHCIGTTLTLDRWLQAKTEKHKGTFDYSLLHQTVCTSTWLIWHRHKWHFLTLNNYPPSRSVFSTLCPLASLLFFFLECLKSECWTDVQVQGVFRNKVSRHAERTKQNPIFPFWQRMLLDCLPSTCIAFDVRFWNVWMLDWRTSSRSISQ